MFYHTEVCLPIWVFFAALLLLGDFFFKQFLDTLDKGTWGLFAHDLGLKVTQIDKSFDFWSHVARDELVGKNFWNHQMWSQFVKHCDASSPGPRLFPFAVTARHMGSWQSLVWTNVATMMGTVLPETPEWLRAVAPFYLVNMLTSSLSSHSKWSTPKTGHYWCACFFRNFIIWFVDDS